MQTVRYTITWALPICRAYSASSSELLPWVRGDNNLSIIDTLRDFGWVNVEGFFEFDPTEMIMDAISFIIRAEQGETLIMAAYELR